VEHNGLKSSLFAWVDTAHQLQRCVFPTGLCRNGP